MLNDDPARPNQGPQITNDVSKAHITDPLPEWLLVILEPVEIPAFNELKGGPAGINTARACDLVAKVLLNFHAPYSADIIDQVCSAIEGNIDWLSEYFKLVTTFSGHDQHSQAVVNNMITLFVILLTGMVETDEHRLAQSRLLASYPVLRGL